MQKQTLNFKHYRQKEGSHRQACVRLDIRVCQEGGEAERERGRELRGVGHEEKVTGAEGLRTQEADRERLEVAYVVSFYQAGGGSVRMVPHFHPTSVDSVPGYSASLSAGRPFAISIMSSIYIVCCWHVCVSCVR